MLSSQQKTIWMMTSRSVVRMSRCGCGGDWEKVRVLNEAKVL